MTIKTGWEEIDALIAEADKVQDELNQIRKDAQDILYPSGKGSSPDNRIVKIKQTA